MMAKEGEKKEGERGTIKKKDNQQKQGRG